MSGPALRPRPPGCLSDLALDRLIAHDLASEEQPRAGAHLDACAACAARLAIIESGRVAAAGAQDFERVRAAAAARTRERQGMRRRWRWPALLAAAGTVTAALALLARPRSSEEDATVRVKGGPALGFYVKHGDFARRGGPDERVSPGDLVRFTYSRSGPPFHLVIVGLDASGRASLYFPRHRQDAAEPLPPGRDVELPGSTILDQTLGAETIYGVFCAAPLDAEAARRAIEASHGAAAAAPACTIERLGLVKVRGP